MHSTRELLPEALVRGEEELSVLGKQQGFGGAAAPGALRAVLWLREL